VEEVARATGRHVLTGSSDEDQDRERELTLEFCARRVDGLIMIPAGERHGYLVPEIQAGTPVVFVDRPAGDIVADTVLVDNIGGAAAAVTHLAAHGHRKIGFLGDAEEIFTARERLRGFREGCGNAGIPFDPRLVAMGPHTQEGITAIVRELVLGPAGATALVSGNNRITVSVVRAIAGLPRRPALVGFDDFELADLLNPPVTVVAHDADALGSAAANLLMARLDGDPSAPKRQTLPVRLVPRGSGETPPP
jgi:LacI family transcriptional regulator